MKRKWLVSIILILMCAYTMSVFIVPEKIDQAQNKTLLLPPYDVSKETQTLYNSLDFIADLHCDALLWSRDLTVKNEIGHVDFPRMQEANMALRHSPL